MRTTHDSTDAEIVAGLLAQRPGALDVFMGRFSPLVSGIAGAVLSSPEDVAEVCQDVFLKASLAIATFDPRRASLATWLGRIAYNTALNAARAVSRRAPTVSLDSESVPVLAAEPPAEPDHRIALLRRALDDLPPPDRTLLHLVYFEDMPVGDAAEILHTNRMALSMRLMRLRKRLASSIRNLNSSSDS